MHSWSKISRRQFLRAFGIFALVPEAEAAEVKEFNITLRRYHFIPPTIEVNQGDRVRINLMSEDVEHGFYLDGYDINTKVSAFKRENDRVYCRQGRELSDAVLRNLRGISPDYAGETNRQAKLQVLVSPGFCRVYSVRYPALSIQG